MRLFKWSLIIKDLNYLENTPRPLHNDLKYQMNLLHIIKAFATNHPLFDKVFWQFPAGGLFDLIQKQENDYTPLAVSTLFFVSTMSQAEYES